jgi:hypothetical protein
MLDHAEVSLRPGVAAVGHPAYPRPALSPVFLTLALCRWRVEEDAKSGNFSVTNDNDVEPCVVRRLAWRPGAPWDAPCSLNNLWGAMRRIDEVWMSRLREQSAAWPRSERVMHIGTVMAPATPDAFLRHAE